MSGVRCQVSGVTFFFLFFFLQKSGGVSQSRVCFQWGLPRLVFIISRDLKKIYPVQCSTVQNRGRSAIQYITVHCKSVICYTVKFNAVQDIELLCIKTIYIFKTFQWSALHIKEVQCNSKDSNIDQCSAVECTAAQPRLTKSPRLHFLRYLVSPVCGIFFIKSRTIMLYKFL